MYYFVITVIVPNQTITVIRWKISLANMKWVLADIIYNKSLSKEDCFDLDSCSGGKGLSYGGCYKWAKSSSDKPSAW